MRIPTTIIKPEDCRVVIGQEIDKCQLITPEEVGHEPPAPAQRPNGQHIMGILNINPSNQPKKSVLKKIVIGCILLATGAAVTYIFMRPELIKHIS